MVCISDTPLSAITGSAYVSRISRFLISVPENENPRFMSLFDKHNKLDHEIARKEGSDLSRVQCGSGPHENKSYS